MQPSIRTITVSTLTLLVPITGACAQTLADLYPELQTLVASDGAAEDKFGASVAIFGDTLAVGVGSDDVGGNVDQGSVRVFMRSGNGWVLQQTLTASAGAAGDQFGASVALYGDTLVVGIPGDDIGANSNQGSVETYMRNGAAWVFTQSNTAPGGASGDAFGSAVSLWEGTLVVGAPFDTVGTNPWQGSAHVYVRSATIWNYAQMLTLADGSSADRFGAVISVYGDTIALGDPYYDVGANSFQGSVRLFERSNGVWTLRQTVTAADGAYGDYFGSDVALDANTLVVGVPYDDVGPNPDRGSVRVFTRSGTTWGAQAMLWSSDSLAEDEFGSRLSLSGDTLAVGAPLADVGANGAQGSVYMFMRSGSTWTAQATLTASGGAGGDRFGGAIAFSGDTLAVGVSGDDVAAASNQGSVRVLGSFRVLNDTTNIGYPSLASAIAGSSAGDRLLVGGRAFSEATGIIDASQKRYTFTAVEPLVLAEGALLNLANDTVFENSPEVAAGGLTVAGKLVAPSGGNLSFEQFAVANEGQFVQRNANIFVNQGFGTTAGGVCYLEGPVLAETVSTTVGAQNRVMGNTSILSDYTNAGATIIQRGILYIYGSLTNTGTITGNFNNGFLPPEPGDGYSVSGDYIMSADASVILSDPVWWLRTSGNFDVAINDASRFDFGQATLELASDNPKVAQSVEVLSRDLGASDAGFATTNFPLGSLRLRAGANAELVDNHNNAPGKQAEAIYTQELVVPAGATLVTNGLKVYTRTATIAGTVSNPSDIVVVPGTPPCVADIVADGVVNGADLALVLTNWGPCATSTCVADIDRDGTVGGSDLSVVLAAWGGCAN